MPPCILTRRQNAHVLEYVCLRSAEVRARVNNNADRFVLARARARACTCRRNVPKNFRADERKWRRTRRRRAKTSACCSGTRRRGRWMGGREPEEWQKRNETAWYYRRGGGRVVAGGGGETGGPEKPSTVMIDRQELFGVPTTRPAQSIITSWLNSLLIFRFTICPFFHPPSPHHTHTHTTFPSCTHTDRQFRWLPPIAGQT